MLFWKEIDNHHNCRTFVWKQDCATHMYINYVEILRNGDCLLVWLQFCVLNLHFTLLILLLYLLLCWSSKTWWLPVFTVCMSFYNIYEILQPYSKCDTDCNACIIWRIICTEFNVYTEVFGMIFLEKSCGIRKKSVTQCLTANI